MKESPDRPRGLSYRMRAALALILAGLVLYTLGVRPSLFGADRSPVVGFVQIAVFLIGLAAMCMGGIVVMNSLWDTATRNEGGEKSILADIGSRLVSTGNVIAVVSGMADSFGFGSQPFPSLPYFGQWQAIGVMVGEVFIIVGFVLMIPHPHTANP